MDELEKKWYKYRVKKMLAPLVGVTTFSFILFGSGYYYVNNSQTLINNFSAPQLTKVLGVSIDSIAMKVESQNEEKLVLKREEIEPTIIVNTPKVEEVVVPVKEVELEPVIPVLDFAKEKKVKVVKRTTKHKTNNKKLVKAKANTLLTVKELAGIRAIKKVTSVPRATKKMHFQSTHVNYITTMEAKFLRSKNPREAVLLAKAYYNKKNYKESEKWALSANKINSSLDESWLIFAKSKAKLGKRKEALSVLVSYYKKSHSSKAKALIGQIKTGKI
jgi:tetratricopeptide (TPR) repeat protein